MRHQLAHLYHRRGDVSAAEVEHRRVLAARSRLAKLPADLGRRDEAVAEYRAVVEARTRVPGADHRTRCRRGRGCPP
ncbi:tetratricopeptide repeat protein [Saccharothrix sp. S26]|uniref:tetratricopeptide repeat protein n=1 Tax=Saccharothrix sp. S26 TaxID=2907215 RepID=UPI0035AC2290